MKTDFTDRYIRNLKPEQKIKDIREKRGFGIRIRPDGTKVFFYGYNSPETMKRRFLTLGEYPAVSLQEARSLYNKAYEIVKAGNDPLEDKQVEQANRLKAPTVTDLVDEYIERHAKRFKRSWRKDERILNLDVVPVWGNRKAEDIAKRDVVVLLEKIVDRGSPAIANNTFQIIRKMFNWAIEKDILPHTPCTGIKLPAPKIVRDRVLSEAEIKGFWINLDKCAMSPEIRTALRLILITGQRSGEIIGMHTCEFDGDWWTIPAERAKNGKAHRVYLTSMAKELINQAIETVKQIRDIPDGPPYNGFVFPCPHQFKVQPINATALAVAVGRNLVLGNNRFELEHFTPHDLRRTAATFMAESGEMDEVIDAILNHAKQGIIKVYNQYRYAKEKQAALDKWAKKLRQIVGIEKPEIGKIIEFRQVAP